MNNYDGISSEDIIVVANMLGSYVKIINVSASFATCQEQQWT